MPAKTLPTQKHQQSVHVHRGDTVYVTTGKFKGYSAVVSRVSKLKMKAVLTTLTPAGSLKSTIEKIPEIYKIHVSNIKCLDNNKV
jgi:ribosomal protein L24